MLFITLQWVLLAETVALAVWTGYLVSFPGVNRCEQGPRHFFSRTMVRFLDLLHAFVIAGFWWNVGYAWATYQPDWRINLLPTVILCIGTVPVVARVLQKATPHSLLLYVTFIVLIVAAFATIVTQNFAVVVVPFAATIGEGILFAILDKKSSRAQQWLNKVLWARPGLYQKVFDARFFAPLTIVAFIETLFQLVGLSLLLPFP